MKSLSIEQKITACFAVIVFMIAVLSWVSLYGLSSMRDRFQVATDVTAKKIGLAGEINMAVGDMLAAQRGMLLYSTWANASRVSESQKVFADRVALIDKDIDELRPLLPSGKERRTLAVLVRDNAEWQTLFLEQERYCLRGDLKAAIQLGEDKATPLYHELDEITDRLVSEQWDLLASDKQRAAITEARNRSASLAVLALVLFVSGLALAIVRRIGATIQRSEREVRERLAEIEQIYNSSPVGLCLFDCDHRYVRINDRLAVLGGTPANQHIGKTLEEMVPSLAGKIVEACRPVLDRGEAVLDVELHFNASGNVPEQFGLASFVPFKAETGELKGVIVSVLDITKRKNAETQIRESEERFSIMAHGCPALIWVTDPGGEVRFINREYRKFTGITYEEAEGTKWQMLVHPEDAPAYLEEYRRAVRECLPFQAEARVRRADGEWRWVYSRAEPRLSAGKEFLGHVGLSIDITDRKRADQDLKKSEERFRQLAENIREVFWMMNAAGTEILYVSPAYEQIWGHSCETLYREPMLWAESIVAEDREEALFLFGRQLQGEAIDSEYRIQTPDGELKWVRDRAFPVRGPDGQITRIVGIAEEITERKRAQEALRRSEQEARERLAEIEQIYQNSPVGMCLLDRDHRYVRVNERLASIGGFPGVNPIGKSIREIIPQLADKIVEADRPVFERGEAVLEVEHCFKASGGLGDTYCLACYVPFKSDSDTVKGVIVSVLDITKRKRAEEALRRSEAEFRTLFDSANDAILIQRNTDGRILEANAAACRHFGYSREELLETSIKQLDGHHDDGFVRDRIAELLERGEILFETTAVRKDGHSFPVEINFRQFEFRGVSAGLAVIRDVRERKEVETAMLKAKEAAEEASQAKSEFLANMSHEIRTPMNAVIGMTGLLLDTDLTPEQRHYGETARESGESLLGLINDILDFSKIEANKLELESREFDLLTLMDNLAGTLGMQANAKGLEFISSADPDVPARLIGDPGRLRQILTNLLGNALKFTRAGEVVLRVAVAAAGPSDCVLRFSVRDTGIGIPHDKIGILFDKFTQVDASTTRDFGGTGLGLAISRQLAELMGGEIGVATAEGKGSEFWFTARMRYGKLLEESEVECHPAARLNGVRVLIVDDNPTSREIVCTQTASWGMLPVEAESALSALQVLYRALEENYPFRIAVVDMQMPGMDGETLGRAIKADSRLARTLLVMMTSLGVRDGEKRWRHIGFTHCMNKPVRRSELHDALCRALSGIEDPGPGHSVAQMERNRRLPRFRAKADARILIAEDNVTNQQVALGMLKGLGLHADTVANGAEAIKSLESLRYDLVLMDIRMPVMDGLEATRRIRDPQSSVLNHQVPIIAMTANVQKSVRDRCIATGMNGFVPKPVSAAAMREALEKFLPVRPGSGSSDAPRLVPTPCAETERPVFDRRSVAERLMGDEELAAKVMEVFLEDTPRQLQALREHLQIGDAHACGRQAHSIKAAAANVGGERLREVAFKMEKAADAGELDVVKNALAELESRFVELSDAIREECIAGVQADFGTLKR